MKRNISDLLDDSFEEIDVTALTPLSSRRIKKRTMSKIESKRKVTRWHNKVAVVAAVFVVMMLTTFAVDAAINEGALWNKLFGRNLSEDQIALMDDIGRTFGESVTINGATITPIRAVADANTYFLYMRVEAPEGVVLPDIKNTEDSYYYYDLGGKYGTDIQIWYQRTSNGKWRKINANLLLTPLADEDPTDNVKEFVAKILDTDGFDFMDRNTKTKLVFTGLYIHKGRSPEMQTLFTGGFAIDISINNANRDNQMLEIDTGGVSFYNEEYDYTTTVNKVKVYALHMELEYSYTTPSDKYIFPYGGPVQFVMKDGTTVEAMEAYFDARNQMVANPDDVAGPRLVCFEEPIVVDNIDYIILGGSHILDVN